jgi:hypothetical protein
VDFYTYLVWGPFKGNATAGIKAIDAGTPAFQPDSTLYRDRDEDTKLALVSKSGFLAQHSGLVAVIH